MADFETRTERVERTTLVLRGETNWVEVQKAFAAARQMLLDRGESPDWDNVVLVEAADDEILIKLPDRELTVLGPREVAHVEADARRVFYRDLLEWVDSMVGHVPGVGDVEEMVRRMRRVDPNNPPWGVADAR